jgi:hypothetical protein|tara:strand:- start:14 stop:382 length:369 start_codon:yes stop_codon:yes gene_type:complete
LLTKILFTLAVILVVALVFRVKNTPAKPATAVTPVPSKGGVSATMVAYTLLGLVIAISALVFVLHWQDQHQVIDIQVTNSQGEALKYQAYKKAIEGRRFTTVDGVSVDLADSDRIEILQTID